MSLNVLAISDRPPRKKIKEILSENHIDLIITLGDLTQQDISELEYIDIPKIGVYGNHDSGMYLEPLGIKNMHLATFEYGDLTFGGFQGCVRYKNDSYAIMCTQEEASEAIKNFPRVDVMLAHCPPYGINDDPSEISHTGFQALREYIETKKPKYFFHGHTYPSKESLETYFGDTQIFYIFQDKIVELR